MAASLTYNSLYLTSWEWVSKINYLTDRTFKVKGAQLSLSSDDPHMSDICPLRLLEQMMGGESQHLELYLWVYKVWWKKKKDALEFDQEQPTAIYKLMLCRKW